MFCVFCGKALQNDMTFCPYCGANTRSGTKSKNNTSKEHSTVHIDAYAIITIFLSICIIISTTFLDIFRFATKHDSVKAEAVFKVFGGSVSISGEDVTFKGDSPLLSIMFVILFLSSVFAVLFACMKKRYGTIICGIINIIVLFIGFFVFCFATGELFESYMVLWNLDASILLMRLPGVGFIIDFILSAVMSFLGIFSLTSEKNENI